MPAQTPAERRARRRAAKTEDILRHAGDQMARDGVGALSLSEVARRVGIRQPSLYKYFPSRNAIYDEVFRRGSVAALQALQEGAAAAAPGLPALEAGLTAAVRLAVEHPVEAQLVSWRPVPGFSPSDAAFAPQVQFLATVRGLVREAVAAGHLRPEADTDRAVSLLSVLVSGVISQQLANEPGVPYETGRFTALTEEALAMYARHFAPPPT